MAETDPSSSASSFLLLFRRLLHLISEVEEVLGLLHVLRSLLQELLLLLGLLDPFLLLLALQLLPQQLSLLVLLGSQLLLLLVLFTGAGHVVLRLTQQVRALPTIATHVLGQLSPVCISALLIKHTGGGRHATAINHHVNPPCFARSQRQVESHLVSGFTEVAEVPAGGQSGLRVTDTDSIWIFIRAVTPSSACEVKLQLEWIH